MKLLLALFTVESMVSAQPEPSDGSCLLARKKQMGRVSSVQEESLMASEQSSLKHRDWRIRHHSLETAMNSSSSSLDKFIASQTDSSDFCSSRLKEAKRVLDGLLHDVHTLNAQVVSQEQVLETEEENLKISKLSLDAVMDEHEEAIAKCEKEREEAFVELKRYTQELEELKQIANPSVRGEIAEGKVQDVKTSGDFSLAEFKLDKKRCEAFVHFARRHRRQDPESPKKDESLDCDKQREELQKAFEEAYKETKELKEEARERTVDETCFEVADAKKTAESVPLISQRDSAAEKIEVASQALASLEPVLNLAKDQAEKLRKHIADTLTPECKEAGEVGELLTKVRELIISLEECPGRNDFKLKIPANDEEATKASQEEKEFAKLQASEGTRKELESGSGSGSGSGSLSGSGFEESNELTFDDASSGSGSGSGSGSLSGLGPEEEEFKKENEGSNFEEEFKKGNDYEGFN